MRAASLLLCASLIACGKKADKPADPPAAQTAKDAMQLLCDAYERTDAKSLNPATRWQQISEWITKEVTNPEVRSLYASLDVMPAAPRNDALSAAATKHGITRCALLDSLRPQLVVPDVAAGGVLPIEDDTAMLIVTPGAIVVEGTSVVAVNQGAIDRAELPRLETYLQALQKAGGKRVAVAVDPSLPFGLLYQVLGAMKRVSFDRAQLVVNQRGVTKQVPLEFPTLAPPDPSQPAQEEPLGLAISLSSGTLALWSISGLEGTRGAPKLTLPAGDKPDLAPLVRALEEITARRHAGKTRSATDKELVVIFDPKTPAQTVASILAAARATDDGKDLYPRFLLSVETE